MPRDPPRRHRARWSRRLGPAAAVASLGHPAYDLYAAGDRPENFYTWGSMGVASSIGLGLAMARPERQVVVLDGDGSLLMNLGSLATIGVVAPANLTIVVLRQRRVRDDGRPADGDRARRRPRRAPPRRWAFARTATVKAIDALATAIDAALAEPGPWVIVAKVKESAPVAKPPLDCVFIKQRFMAAIGSAERRHGRHGGEGVTPFPRSLLFVPAHRDADAAARVGVGGRGGRPRSRGQRARRREGGGARRARPARAA